MLTQTVTAKKDVIKLNPKDSVKPPPSKPWHEHRRMPQKWSDTKENTSKPDSLTKSLGSLTVNEKVRL